MQSTIESIGIATDAIVIRGKKVLLVKRAYPPFKGCWVLPGGFVEHGETTEKAVKREVKEETGLDVTKTELFGVYSNPNRDPRGHIISIVYVCKVRGAPRITDETRDFRWFSLKDLPRLAFDHGEVIKDFKKRLI